MSAAASFALILVNLVHLGLFTTCDDQVPCPMNIHLPYVVKLFFFGIFPQIVLILYANLTIRGQSRELWIESRRE